MSTERSFIVPEITQADHLETVGSTLSLSEGELRPGLMQLISPRVALALSGISLSALACNFIGESVTSGLQLVAMTGLFAGLVVGPLFGPEGDGAVRKNAELAALGLAAGAVLNFVLPPDFVTGAIIFEGITSAGITITRLAL